MNLKNEKTTCGVSSKIKNITIVHVMCVVSKHVNTQTM